MNKTVKIPSAGRLLPAALLLCGLSLATTACNDKSKASEDETESIVYLPNVAVTAFNLKANKNVMQKLDSVFFSIDLEHGVIFNADSLPKGTPINRLVANISYSAAIKSAKIIMSGGTTRNDTIDYLKKPGDSIDFTGNVRLILATDRQEMEKTYTIKVNVHKQIPDSLVWDQTAVVALPSRLSNPRNQKTISVGQNALSLIEESNGTYTLASSPDIYANTWTKDNVTFSFRPNVRSFTATEDSSFYILDDKGNLYSSSDAKSWRDTGEDWAVLIGDYKETVIGLKTTPEGLKYSQYPLMGLEDTLVDPRFPIDGYSNFAVHSNKWTSSPVGFFCGGVLADGSLSDATWAFDGKRWIVLSEGGFPKVKGASLVPYHAFRKTSSDEMIPSEFNVWMILGGEMENNVFNRTLYISYDNGVNWKMGDSLIQLPDVIPAMTDCDNLVMTTTKDSNLSDAWSVVNQPQRKKVRWSVDGDILSWECPYIYLFGGFAPGNTLYNTIWRGALNRLQSPPVI